MTQHAGRMRTLPLAKQQRGPWPAVTLDGGGVYVQAMMYPSKLSCHGSSLQIRYI